MFAYIHVSVLNITQHIYIYIPINYGAYIMYEMYVIRCSYIINVHINIYVQLNTTVIDFIHFMYMHVCVFLSFVCLSVSLLFPFFFSWFLQK